MTARKFFGAFIALALAATAATPAAAQKFAMTGDVGGDSFATSVGKFAVTKGAEFVVLAGDNCYDGVPFATQLNATYGGYRVNNNLYAALGNHEFSDACGGGAAKGFFNYFQFPNNERYYDFVRGNVHFFVVNSEGTPAGNLREPDGSGPTSKQAMWIKQKMLASTSPWKVVVFHRPPFSSGEHGGIARMRWPFKEWGASFVVSGHDHNYERFDKAGLPYVVAGLGGRYTRPFRTTIAPNSVKRYNAKHGLALFNATSTSITMEFRNTDDVLIDSLTLNKAAAKTTSGGSTAAPAPTTPSPFEFRVPN